MQKQTDDHFCVNLLNDHEGRGVKILQFAALVYAYYRTQSVQIQNGVYSVILCVSMI